LDADRIGRCNIVRLAQHAGFIARAGIEQRAFVRP
jgi:hypothetical protein